MKFLLLLLLVVVVGCLLVSPVTACRHQDIIVR